MPKLGFFTSPKEQTTIYAETASKSQVYQVYSDEQLLYSYGQGSKTIINFYVNKEGKLQAETVREGKQEIALSIKGIPELWQVGLDNKEKREQLKRALIESYSNPSGYDVVVNPKGLGGWLDEVHAGYQGKPRQLRTGQIWYCQNTPGIDGTFRWAIDSGLSLPKAGLVAGFCRDVDYGDLGPTKNQSYHFNTAFEEYEDYSSGDSRVVLAVQHMSEAIEYFHEYQKMLSHLKKLAQKINHEKELLQLREAAQGELHPSYYQKLQKMEREYSDLHMQSQKQVKIVFGSLGIGLHPLQDMYAHTAEFVYRDSSLFFGWQFHLNNGADDSKIHPQRYDNTAIATKLYFEIFLYNTGQTNRINMQIPQSKEFDGFMKALREQGMEVPSLSEQAHSCSFAPMSS